jgi:hypothetical protein
MLEHVYLVLEGGFVVLGLLEILQDVVQSHC